MSVEGSTPRMQAHPQGSPDASGVNGPASTHRQPQVGSFEDQEPPEPPAQDAISIQQGLLLSGTQDVRASGRFVAASILGESDVFDSCCYCYNHSRAPVYNGLSNGGHAVSTPTHNKDNVPSQIVSHHV